MIKLFAIKSKVFKKATKVSAPSFFDYKAVEKKRIVKKATRESNRLQLDLVKKYNSLQTA